MAREACREVESTRVKPISLVRAATPLQETHVFSLAKHVAKEGALFSGDGLSVGRYSSADVAQPTLFSVASRFASAGVAEKAVSAKIPTSRGGGRGLPPSLAGNRVGVLPPRRLY